MATVKGTLILIKVDDKLLIGQRSSSVSKSTTMIPTSSKTTGDHATFIGGRHSSTMSVSGIASSAPELTEAGYWELWAKQEANVPVTVTETEYTQKDGETAVLGAILMTQMALVSGLTKDNPDDAESTFSCDLQITGAPIKAVNAGA